MENDTYYLLYYCCIEKRWKLNCVNNSPVAYTKEGILKELNDGYEGKQIAVRLVPTVTKTVTRIVFADDKEQETP